MQILIDNKDLSTVYGITVLDYSPVFDFPSERVNEREWFDKSGVDKNLENIRYDSKEFVLSCYVKVSNIALAYAKVNTLVEYMFLKGVFVLSLRDITLGIRECFLCERSSTIVGVITIREQSSLYQFKLGLKDVNPNALKFNNTITGLATTINYTKGQTAVLYWGDGTIAQVSNSGDYTKSDYSANGPVDIIIDIDKNAEVINELNADFTADVVSGVKPLIVQFTDTSTGVPEIWSWDFGDGYTSAEQNPQHTYTVAGTYTVTLQIFNAAAGNDVETKTDYITVRNARILANDSGDFILANSTDYILKN